MSGFWKNGLPFTYGGDAFGGNTATKHVYTGNPATGTGWTEAGAGNTVGDRRVIFSSGPFTLPAGAKIEWSYAVVFSQDTSQAVNTITQFNTRVQRDVRNVRYYDAMHSSPQCTPQVSQTVGIRKHAQELAMGIYPSPAKDELNIELEEYASLAQVVVTDVAGRKVMESRIVNDRRTSLNIAPLAKGVYFVEVSSDDKKAVQKVIKQ
jgi:hypothetical protein